MKEFILFFLLFFLFKNFYSLPFFKNTISNRTNSNDTITYIYGHKNPDCDSICSAIGMADYLKKIGYNSKDIIPCSLGELNKEIKYALNQFEIEDPLLISNLTGDYEVILVDHNSPSQSLVIDREKIIGVIDHHALVDFETLIPVKIISNPIGSTCTIIYELFKSNNIEISNKTAGLLISGIISDTLLLKESSTTTQEDIDAFNDLTNILKIDTIQYGYNLLLKSTDISDMTEKDIINMDSKSYIVNEYPIQIGCIKTVNVTDVLTRKQLLIKEIDTFIKEKRKVLFTIMIVDILKLDTTLIVRGNYSYVVESAFGIKLEDDQAFLKGVTSRKNQVYPKIAKILEDLEEYEDPSINNDDNEENEQNKNNDNKNKSNHKKIIMIIAFSILGLILIIIIFFIIIRSRRRNIIGLKDEVRKSFVEEKELKVKN